MNSLAEQYIERRFPDAHDSYKNEWRARFAHGDEWYASDLVGQSLLVELAPDNYPPERSIL